MPSADELARVRSALLRRPFSVSPFKDPATGETFPRPYLRIERPKFDVFHDDVFWAAACV